MKVSALEYLESLWRRTSWSAVFLVRQTRRSAATMILRTDSHSRNMSATFIRKPGMMSSTVRRSVEVNTRGG